MARRTYGATGRFGTRYGKTTRDKIGKAEEAVKKSKKCPYCNKEKVKKISNGIWGCEKCGAKFTAKAYNFDRKAIILSSQKEESTHIDVESAEEEIQNNVVVEDEDVSQDSEEESQETESNEEKKE